RAAGPSGFVHSARSAAVSSEAVQVRSFLAARDRGALPSPRLLLDSCRMFVSLERAGESATRRIFLRALAGAVAGAAVAPKALLARTRCCASTAGAASR